VKCVADLPDSGPPVWVGCNSCLWRFPNRFGAMGCGTPAARGSGGEDHGKRITAAIGTQEHLATVERYTLLCDTSANAGWNPSPTRVGSTRSSATAHQGIVLSPAFC